VPAAIGMPASVIGSYSGDTAEFAKSLSAVLRTSNRALILASSEEDPEVERQEIRTLLRRGIDVLLIASCQPSLRNFYELGDERTPYLLFDRNFPHLAAHFVGSNDILVGEMATNHLIECGHKRIAHIASQAGHNQIVAMAEEEGRDAAKIGSALYHNINIKADRQTALNESKAFLDKYYTSNFSMKFVEGFTTAGTPEQCVEELKAYFAAGIEHITLRMTSWDQIGQLQRFLEKVAPACK